MQQMYSCPNCGAPVAFGVRFCTNCGTPLNWPSQPQAQPPPAHQESPSYQEQPATQRKRTSGWAKFGRALVILGILCLIACPIIALIGSSDGFEAYEISLIIRAAVLGFGNIVVGGSLTRVGGADA